MIVATSSIRLSNFIDRHAGRAIKACFPSLTHPAIKAAQQHGGVVVSSSSSSTSQAGVQQQQHQQQQPLISVETPDAKKTNARQQASSSAPSTCRLPSPRLFIPGSQQQQITSLDQLLPLAEIAPFGRGEETVVDENFRKTLRVLPPKCIVEWNPHLGHAVAEFARKILLLPESQVHHLGAELHNVLIYREGDFFAPHRDSYKTDGHVGTLSILVDLEQNNITSNDDSTSSSSSSSSIEGGTLRFAAGDKVIEWNASPDRRWAAWIGSVRHEVTKVTQGSRVVAVFNLVLRPPSSSDDSKKPDEALVRGSPLPSTSNITVGAASSHVIDEFADKIRKADNIARKKIPELQKLTAEMKGTKNRLRTDQIMLSDLHESMKKVKYFPVVLPLRNHYSTGGSHDSTIPPQYLWGQDLLLYESAVRALGKSKVKVVPMSIVRHEDEYLRWWGSEYPAPFGFVREVVEPVSEVDPGDETEHVVAVGDLMFEYFEGDVCFDAVNRLLGCPFPANAIPWGAGVFAAENWCEPIFRSRDYYTDIMTEKENERERKMEEELQKQYEKESSWKEGDGLSEAELKRLRYDGPSEDTSDDEAKYFMEINIDLHRGWGKKMGGDDDDDPLLHIPEDGSTWGLKGNDATFSVLWYRRAALCFVLGVADDEEEDNDNQTQQQQQQIDFSTLLGPPPKDCIPTGFECEVAPTGECGVIRMYD